MHSGCEEHLSKPMKDYWLGEFRKANEGIRHLDEKLYEINHFTKHAEREAWIEEVLIAGYLSIIAELRNKKVQEDSVIKLMDLLSETIQSRVAFLKILATNPSQSKIPKEEMQDALEKYHSLVRACEKILGLPPNTQYSK